jgi:LPXTG-motif cell wall-anchored protein
MIDASTSAMGTNNSCNGGFSGSDFTANGDFNKTVTINGQPATNGMLVQPNTTIAVTLTWNPANFSGQQDMISDCVGTTTDGSNFTVDQPQSQASLQKPVPVGESSYTTSYTVPAADAGLQICDRGRISGVGASGQAGTEKSNRFCFPVGPGTSVPETSHPALLILGAVLAGGLGLLFVQRRRRRRGDNG